MNERLPLCASAERALERAKRGTGVSTPAVLALEDGTVFRGVSVGAKGNTTGEVVFNTAMTGYQEILTDPSYCRQIVTLTYPHIGNTGTTPEDLESGAVYAAGLVIRDLPRAAFELARHRVARAASCCAVRWSRSPTSTRASSRACCARRARRPGCIMTGENHRRDRRGARRPEVSGPEGHGSGQSGLHQEDLPVERRGHLEIHRQAAAAAKPPARGGLRLRHQAQHPAHPRRAWLPHDGGARTNYCRSSTCDES